MNMSSLEEEVDAHDRSRWLLLVAAASGISASESDAWEGAGESTFVSEDEDESRENLVMMPWSV